LNKIKDKFLVDNIIIYIKNEIVKNFSYNLFIKELKNLNFDKSFIYIYIYMFFFKLRYTKLSIANNPKMYKF